MSSSTKPTQPEFIFNRDPAINKAEQKKYEEWLKKNEMKKIEKAEILKQNGLNGDGHGIGNENGNKKRTGLEEKKYNDIIKIKSKKPIIHIDHHRFRHQQQRAIPSH